MLTLREGHANDLPFLRLMLLEAYHWNHLGPRPPVDEFLGRPNILERLEDWRPHDGDRAVIAEATGKPIGAAWYRFGTADNHGYGYIDPLTPELGIGVVTAQRKKGVGRQLLNALIEVARRERVGAISLSVDPANHALKLYESVGFHCVKLVGTSMTMVLKL